MRPNSTIVVHCAIREDFFFPLLQLRNYVSASLVYTRSAKKDTSEFLSSASSLSVWKRRQSDNGILGRFS